MVKLRSRLIMDLYKPVLKYLVMPLWAKWENSKFLKDLKYLNQSQYFDEEKIMEIQWTKISSLLDHAYTNCRYYRNIFDKMGIHPNQIKSFDDFKSIPILTKDDVLENFDDLLAPNVDKYYSFLTSGSTGKPLRGYRDKECHEFKRACGRRSELWSGYDLGERIYCLYGNPEKEKKGLSKYKAKMRRKFISRTEILNMLQMTEESIMNFVKKMQKKPPSLIWGHAHGLFQLALFMEKRGINNIKPKGMYSAGMILYDWQRDKIEKVFNCVLQDRYGTEELGLVATECKQKEGLHINTDAHYVEILDKSGQHVKPGVRGYIVVTDLTNRAMPFIRYKLEDIGAFSEKKCSCGRSQPMIDKIFGRVADFLITPQNELVSGISLTDHFAGHIPGIGQIQIVQEKINFLKLKIVKNNKYDEESTKRMEVLIEDFFGKDMKYQIEFAKKIHQDNSGKYRFTICKVNHDLLN